MIYQVYVRSFADSDGDGTGDLTGVHQHLDHLSALGVDAMWFSPWYPSPLADGGYDVADYRDIDPRFGTIADAERLIRDAADRGIGTIVDIVPNHVSAAHDWFVQALRDGPGSPARQRFWFRPGGGPGGDEPPNNWTSIFGGPAWTRVTEPDGAAGEWYLHLFAPEQPDLNWDSAEVRAEHEDVLRFWFDRGAAGVRIDSAALLIKDPELPAMPVPAGAPDPHTDRDELHDIYRSWRRIAESYPDPRILVGELWLPDAERFARYLRPDELHTAFNFDFLGSAWDAAVLRRSIETTLAVHAPVAAPATWVLSNHDVTRPITRYGRADSSFAFETMQFGVPSDETLGRARARAAALLAMALPGAMYIYQGEELGLPDVELPRESLQDPMYFRSNGVRPGRDGCRVPLPWTGDHPPYGFSPDDAPVVPWLPQPQDWATLTVTAESAQPDSMLTLYRTGLRLRRDRWTSAPDLVWLETGDDATQAGPEDRSAVLAFRRGELACVVNFGPAPIALPEGEVLLASGPLTDDLLPADTTAWLVLPPAPARPKEDMDLSRPDN